MTNRMNKQIDTLLQLADEWADECAGCDTSHFAASSYRRKALRDALEAALKPGELGEADVWHEGSRSFYRAKLVRKLTAEEVDAEPPAQTPPRLTDEHDAERLLRLVNRWI